MGYSTKFEGELKVPKGFTMDMLKKLRKLLHTEYAPDGALWNYMGFKLTEDLDAIKWSGDEKFYGAEDAVNWLTSEMREEFPDFKFSGRLLAQGDEVGDIWTLHVDEDGLATKKDSHSVEEPKRPCDACDGMGWGVEAREEHGEVQRCEKCKRFESDEDVKVIVPSTVLNMIDYLNNETSYFEE